MTLKGSPAEEKMTVPQRGNHRFEPGEKKKAKTNDRSDKSPRKTREGQKGRSIAVKGSLS